MKVALCTRNPGNPVIRLLARALEQDRSHVDVISDPRQVLDAERWDVGFWRPDAKDASVAAFSRQAALILEGLGTPFLNDLTSMERAGSKVVSHALFAAARLPVVPMWLAPYPGRPFTHDVQGPVVVKPIWGKRARGVALCNTLEAALEHARGLGMPAVLQEAVPWRYQYRCVATQREVVRIFRDENSTPKQGAIRRFDRVNAQPFDSDVDEEIHALATTMVRAVGGDLMRADVLEDAAGRRWALEVNSSFGFPHHDQVVIDAFLASFRAAATRA